MHSKALSGICAPLIFFGLSVASLASDQPNPYKFPAATGVAIPIAEGYWATSQEACAKLQLTDETRPHVGLKGFAIANSDSFPSYTFQYFGPRLGNWPDGLCYVLAIKRDTGSKFLVNGFCGSEPGDSWKRENQFTAAVVVHSERQISITGKNVVPAGDYFFCRSVKNRK